MKRIVLFLLLTTATVVNAQKANDKCDEKSCSKRGKCEQVYSFLKTCTCTDERIGGRNCELQSWERAQKEYPDVNYNINGGFKSGVSGWKLNQIRGSPDSSFSTILAGKNNKISGSSHASIGAGEDNMVYDNSDFAAIASGYRNDIREQARFSTIIGGKENTIRHEADFSFVGGGQLNTVRSHYSAISGGAKNSVFSNFGYIGGGFSNLVLGRFSSILGGAQNTVFGRNSVALGYKTVLGSMKSPVDRSAVIGLSEDSEAICSTKSSNTLKICAKNIDFDLFGDFRINGHQVVLEDITTTTTTKPSRRRLSHDDAASMIDSLTSEIGMLSKKLELLEQMHS